MIYEATIIYKFKTEQVSVSGKIERYIIEANHILDANWKLCQGFPSKYAEDVREIIIISTDKKIFKDPSDKKDPIREGTGWKAQEGRG